MPLILYFILFSYPNNTVVEKNFIFDLKILYTLFYCLVKFVFILHRDKRLFEIKYT